MQTSYSKFFAAGMLLAVALGSTVFSLFVQRLFGKSLLLIGLGPLAAISLVFLCTRYFWRHDQ